MWWMCEYGAAHFQVIRDNEKTQKAWAKVF